jgi:hypothetical protein
MSHELGEAVRGMWARGQFVCLRNSVTYVTVTDFYRKVFDKELTLTVHP